MDAFIALCKSLPSAGISGEVLQLLTVDLGSPSPLLRSTVLKALLEIGGASLPPDHTHLQVALLVARHDEESESRTLADK